MNEKALMDRRTGEWWYISKDSTGHLTFTQDASQAQTDRYGIPLICPGDMNRVWKAEQKRMKEKRNRLWTRVLDLMELEIEVNEKEGQAFLDGNVDLQERLAREKGHLQSKAEGLLEALIEFELPENRSSTWEDDMAWAKGRANQMYEAEMED